MPQVLKNSSFNIF